MNNPHKPRRLFRIDDRRLSRGARSGFTILFGTLALAAAAQAPSQTPSNAATQNSSPSPAEPMGFSDQPNFTVAGVVDWTAVGGHGSDSILRTSEDLARETLTLKSKGDRQQEVHNSRDALDDQAAEAKLRTTLAGAPGSFTANHQLGAFYLRTGRYAEALPLLQAAERIDPAQEGNEHDLALAYKETGNDKAALEHVQQLLKHDNSADLHRLASELDEKLADPLAAVQEDEQAVRLDPSEQNYFAWGSELLLHRAVWQAVEVFRSGVKAYPKSPRLQTALGTALFAGALYDQAAQHLCQASDLDPANPEPYLFMGKIEMAAPTPLACIEPKLARFVQKRPNDAFAKYLYAMSLWKRQPIPADKADAQQVKDLLTKAVAIDPACSPAYLQLGIMDASEHAYERAIPLYAQAIAADPQLAESHYRLGVAYDRTGEVAKAKQEFQLYDQLQKEQAAAVERERREVKQFLVVQQGLPSTPGPH